MWKDEEPVGRKGGAGHARPAFKRQGGTVTAFNASSLSDGAAALVLMCACRSEPLVPRSDTHLTAISHAITNLSCSSFHT